MHRPGPAGTRRVVLAGAVLAAVSAWHVPAAAQQPRVLTLPDAIAEALARNDRLIDQQDALAHADLAVDQAEHAFRLQVVPNIVGSFGQTDVTSQTYRVDVARRFVTGTELRLGVGTSTAQIPAPAGGTGDDLRYYNSDTTFSISQPLLRGMGRAVTRAGLTTAESGREEARRARTQAEQQVALDVAAAYYRIVAQETFVAIARQSLDRARRLHAASAAKLAAGLVSQLDVLRATQLVTLAEGQQLDAEASAADARDQLTFLLGRPSGDRIDVSRDLPAPALDPLDVDDATTVALAHRTEIASRAAAREAADLRLRSARNQLLPQVDVNFAATRRPTSHTFLGSFGFDRFQYATFFTVGLPTDRLGVRTAFQSALLDLNRRTREDAVMARQIADDVRRASRERERLRRAIATAETSVEIARKEVEVAELRYERGLSNNLDVVTAEGGLLAAEARRVQVLAESAVARLRWLAVLGTFDPRRDVLAPPAPTPAVAAVQP